MQSTDVEAEFLKLKMNQMLRVVVVIVHHLYHLNGNLLKLMKMMLRWKQKHQVHNFKFGCM